MEQRPTICLNMIVKNERHVIERCLSDVKPLIDHWVIVDTGSDDGTQDLIREIMADVPGVLHERDWKNFGHNRSEAIALAEGCADYILTIDADETMPRTNDFDWGALGADAYLIEKWRYGRAYRVMNLVRDGLDWRWRGVVHEYLQSDHSKPPEMLDGIHIQSPREGARARDALTYRRDALMLEQALLEEPTDARSVFYLGQSYRDAEDFDLALRYYRQRAQMGGWQEEIYVALLNVARLLNLCGAPFGEVVAALLEAHGAMPSRAEALYDLGMLYSGRQEWPNAWLFLERAARIQQNPHHILFIDAEVYQWRAKLEAAVAAYWVGAHEDAIEFNEALLAGADLPEKWRKQVAENLALSQHEVMLQYDKRRIA